MRARAIVLDTGGERAALVQVDLGGIPYALVQRVYELIPDAGIPLENIMIAATHTHSSTGPIWPIDSTGYAALGGDAFDPRVFEFTAQGIAQGDRPRELTPRPGRARHREDARHDASRNRNFEPFKRNEDIPKDEAGAKEASIDPALTVIRVDEPDGQPDRRVVQLRDPRRPPSGTRTCSSRATTPRSRSGSSRTRSAGTPASAETPPGGRRTS